MLYIYTSISQNLDLSCCTVPASYALSTELRIYELYLLQAL